MKTKKPEHPQKQSNRTFFTSDTHFGHTNIIRHCSRPFRSADDMDSYLIRTWNNVVGHDDTVYHLGDFSTLPDHRIAHILSQLNGRKHLIRGNHDKRTHRAEQWIDVQDTLHITVDGHKVFLCHYPMREWPGMWKGGLHLYGHVHGNMKSLPGSMDVGSDVWGGRPVQVADMLPYIEPFDAQKVQREHITWLDWEDNS